MSTLILDPAIREKLDAINYTEPIWQSKNINSTSELLELIIDKINGINKKIKLRNIEFFNNGIRSNYYGHIVDEGRIIAYLFIVQPGNVGRNIVAQNTMPGLRPLIQNCIPSRLFKIIDKPCFLIYLNEDELQKSKSQELISLDILNFHIIDIFERDLYSKIRDSHHFYDLYSVSTYNDLLKFISGTENKYFNIFTESKTILLKTETLGEAATNERYFYLLKNYPILYLGSREGYKFDLSELTVKNYANEDITTFIQFAQKFNN